MVKPSTPPALFFWSMANLTPFAVAWPPIVHTGRSEPILMVPLLVPPPPPPPPQAKATRVAAVRTISPLARTIWFPLVLVGRQMRNKPHLTPPITCRPLPNSSRGESAPAASAATWDGRTATPRQRVGAEGPTSQVEPGSPVPGAAT